MRATSSDIETNGVPEGVVDPVNVSISLGADSGTLFLTRFEGTRSDSRGNSAKAGSSDVDELLGLRGGFDESLGLPVVKPVKSRRAGLLRRIVGVMAATIVVAGAGFGLGAGFADGSASNDPADAGAVPRIAEPITAQAFDRVGLSQALPHESDDVSRGEDQRDRQLTRPRVAASTPDRLVEAEARAEDNATEEENSTADDVSSEPDANVSAELEAVQEPSEPAPPVVSPAGGEGELSELVTGALTVADDHEVAQQIQSTLTRPQVIAGMRGVSRQVMNCTSSERVLVDATIDGSGAVTAARVLGPLAGTAEGACIERSVRRAQFPHFGSERLNVHSYPFVLRSAGPTASIESE